MRKKITKQFTVPELLEKLRHYCAYQERSLQEIKQKHLSLGGLIKDFPDILEQLEEGNFWNEQRFAEAYARGKFNIKGWGKQKIKAQLFVKGIDNNLAEQALTQINQQEYLAKAEYWVEKQKLIGNEKQQVISYLSQKGFEWPIIQQALSNNEFD